MVLVLNLDSLIETTKPVNGLYILWIIAKESKDMVYICIEICTLLEHIFIHLPALHGRLSRNPIYYISPLTMNQNQS